MDLAKMAFAAAAMAAAAPGFLDACAADFPLAGGDLSLAGNWGGEMPGKSASVAIANDGTYTASSDLAFGSLSVNAAGVTFDFSQTPSAIAFSGTPNSAESTSTRSCRRPRSCASKGAGSRTAAKGIPPIPTSAFRP